MLAGEMTLEALVVEVNPQLNSPLAKVRPVEPNRGEWDGEGAAGGSHLEQGWPELAGQRRQRLCVAGSEQGRRGPGAAKKIR